MGGSGGHMRHPHDLDEVKTGEDIIALFRAIPNYLRSEEFTSGAASSLKLDGSNNAIKVVRKGKDGIQFAVDRASQSPLDVNGVTLDKIKQRFTKVMKSGEVKFNAGLANSSAGLINMMDKAYKSNPERMWELLQRLGLIDKEGNPDSTKFINIEYIERKADDIDLETGMGRANAIYYSFDSITFLNISQYYQVERKGIVIRPGAERPTVTALDDDGNTFTKVSSDVSTPVKLDKTDLDDLADLAGAFAPKGFSVLGPGDLGIRVDHDIATDASEEEINIATEKAIEQLEKNIEATLNSNLTFVINDQNAVTRPLKEWLDIAINFPYKPDITLVDGSKQGPFTKEIHKQLVDLQTPLAELVPLGPNSECLFNGKMADCEKAVYGAVFYEAARRLGNTIKQSLQAKVDKFGSAVDHEGVVINAGMPFGDKITGNTFKLTGEFIVDGSQGVYAIREENLQNLTIVWDADYNSTTATLTEWKNQLHNVSSKGHITINRNNKQESVMLDDSIAKLIMAGTPLTSLVTSPEDGKKALKKTILYVEEIRKHPLSWAKNLTYTESLLTERNGSGTVLYLPGGFKPPHKGHFALAQDALSQYPGAQLVIMSGESPRGDITLDKARNVWDIYFKSIGEEKNVAVRALEPEYPRDADGNRMRKYVRGAGVRTPISYSEWKEINLKGAGIPEADMEALYERAKGIPKNGKTSLVLDDDGNPITVEFMTTSPINSIASAIRFKDKPKRAIIVASEEDPENATSLAQSLQKQGLAVDSLIVPVRVKDKAGSAKMSATNMRQAIGQGFEEFVQFLPDELDDQQMQEVFTMLGANLAETSTSANSQGSAFGAKGGPWHGLNVKQANKEQERDSKSTLRQAHEFISEEDEIVNEVADYLLGITVG